MDYTSKTCSYPTAGQLEREVSQQVRAMYRSQFGHQPSKVECHLFGNKLIIFLEDVITPVEKLLLEGKESSSLIAQLRTFVRDTIRPKLKELVEEIFKVGVTNCLYDVAVDTGCSGAIVVLADPPQIRRSRTFKKRDKSYE